MFAVAAAGIHLQSLTKHLGHIHILGKSLSKRIQAIRGMNDILPEQTPVWQYLEASIARTLQSYGYREIRMPVLEVTELFKRSVGEATDIVAKEMYSFDDRNGDSLTLRPEGTASCVRAAEQAGLLYNQVQRLWYTGPMFRYERPQKGRYRQFYQVGVEAFGMSGPDIDAELIIMTARLWQVLGLEDAASLQLNSIGSSAVRASYGADLVTYLKDHFDQLDSDSQQRLSANPLRILDSKSESTQKVLENAPVLANYLDDESRQHFESLCATLDHVGIKYDINPRLVRGLDYYSKTVFEWVTDQLGAQGTICAGGRYDGLVAQLGGKATPAVGFAMGLERLVLLLAAKGLPGDLNKPADVYFIALGEAAQLQALVLAEQIRTQIPNLRLITHCGGGNFKAQLKKADFSGAEYALIIGDKELASDTLLVKPLRGQADQVTIAADDSVTFLKEKLQNLFDPSSG